MTELDEQRFSWGEAVALDGQQADLVRTILEDPNSDNSRAAAEHLRTIFIPIVEACRKTRDEIKQAAADYEDGLERIPEEGGASYDEACRSLDGIEATAKKTYQNRPAGCEMVDKGDCWFDCNRCDFEESVLP